MPFNLSEFSANINKRGIAVSNLFVLDITPPPGMQSTIPVQELSFFCRSVDIPDMTLKSLEVKPLGYGAMQSFPMGMDYDSLNCDFMVDQDMHIIKFFNKWMQMIYNYNTEGGIEATINKRGVYELEYKEVYTAPALDVYIFSGHDMNSVHKISYKDVFPISTKLPQLAWGNSAEIMSLPVQFRYSSFKTDGTVAGVLEGGPARNGINIADRTFGNRFPITDLPRVIKDINNVKKQVNAFGALLRDF